MIKAPFTMRKERNPMNLSQEQIEQIRSMYMERTKIHHIAEITGFTLWAIKKVIYDPNHRIKRPKNLDTRKRSAPAVKPKPAIKPVELSKIQARILVLTNFGYNPKEIAQDLQIEPQKVRKEIRYLDRAKKIQKRV